MNIDDINTIQLTPIEQFKSTWVSQKLKNFPKCNIRYGTDNGHGFILIGPDFSLKQYDALCEKIIAVLGKAFKGLRIAVIPKSYASAMGI